MRAVLHSLLCSIVLFAGRVCAASSDAQELPSFLGFLRFSSGNSTFVVRWKESNGGAVQAWLQIGQRAGNYKLIEFDPIAEVLSVEDLSGRRHRLVLPEGKVRPMLTEKEFFDLIKFTEKGADTTDAPVLSREQARAFFLRFINEVSGPAGVEVVFDMDGSTLPPSSRATWAEDKARARAADRLLLAVRINEKTEVHEFPRKFLSAPIQMTQNLSDDEWDELALLLATQTLKSRVLRKVR